MNGWIDRRHSTPKHNQTVFVRYMTLARGTPTSYFGAARFQKTARPSGSFDGEDDMRTVDLWMPIPAAPRGRKFYGAVWSKITGNK